MENQTGYLPEPAAPRRSSRKLKMCPKRSRLTLKLAEAMQKLTAVDWEIARLGPQKTRSLPRSEAFAKWIYLLEEIRLHSVACSRFEHAIWCRTVNRRRCDLW
jgi:hypothetical protein